jgi:hypothetical protein
MMDLNIGFNLLREERTGLYRPYTFNAPVVMTTETADQLSRLGKILNKAILYLMAHYEKYLDIFPRSPQELTILEICRNYPYKTGTFRGDFVIDTDNAIKIIEFNVRQPLNGYFDTFFFLELAFAQGRELNVGGIVDLCSGFCEYFAVSIGDAKRICVIYGNAPPADRKFYPRLFIHSGIECCEIYFTELPEKLDLLTDAYVICEFLHDEIINLPLNVIERIAAAKCHNPIPAALTAGVKRILPALSDQIFLQHAVTNEEAEFLNRFIVPTYLYRADSGIWEDAREHKEKYILKHSNRGRSEEVYAGILTSPAKWHELMKPPYARQMVLQPFIEQKLFTGEIGKEMRRDYISGILLYFDEQFFGPGLYRTHVSPIGSGTGNFRKIAPLVADGMTRIPGLHYL